MTRDELSTLACNNRHELQCNDYPGRLVFVGMSADGRYVILATALGGRSQESSDRDYGVDGGRVFVVKQSTGQPGDDPLRFYDAMLEARGIGERMFIAGNGSQTGRILTDINQEGASFHDGLEDELYEPDGLSTHRLTAYWNSAEAFEIGINSRSIFDNTPVWRHWKFETIEPGFGFYVCTYAGFVDNPRPFTGDPRLLQLGGGQQAVIRSLWDLLDVSTRVALAVKFIPLKSSSESKVMTIRSL